MDQYYISHYPSMLIKILKINCIRNHISIPICREARDTRRTDGSPITDETGSARLRCARSAMESWRPAWPARRPAVCGCVLDADAAPGGWRDELMN